MEVTMLNKTCRLCNPVDEVIFCWSGQGSRGDVFIKRNCPNTAANPSRIAEGMRPYNR
jgi:hypothetical protein